MPSLVFMLRPFWLLDDPLFPVGLIFGVNVHCSISFASALARSSASCLSRTACVDDKRRNLSFLVSRFVFVENLAFLLIRGLNVHSLSSRSSASRTTSSLVLREKRRFRVSLAHRMGLSGISLFVEEKERLCADDDDEGVDKVVVVFCCPR